MCVKHVLCCVFCAVLCCYAGNDLPTLKLWERISLVLHLPLFLNQTAPVARLPLPSHVHKATHHMEGLETCNNLPAGQCRSFVKTFQNDSYERFFDLPQLCLRYGYFKIMRLKLCKDCYDG